MVPKPWRRPAPQRQTAAPSWGVAKFGEPSGCCPYVTGADLISPLVYTPPILR